MIEERLSLRGAADALGISEVTARRWVKTGKLKAYKPGLKYLIPASAIEELLEDVESKKAPAPLRATSREVYASWSEERRKSFWHREQRKLERYDRRWREQAENPEAQEQDWCDTVQLIALGWAKILNDFGIPKKEECSRWEWYAYGCFRIAWLEMNDAADLVEKVAAEKDEAQARARRQYTEELKEKFPAA
jgi:excisionase family DNA binding protein